MGYEIWWPVISEFKWLGNYIKGINFYDKGDSNYNTPLMISDKFYHIYNEFNPIFTDELVYLPLQMADKHYSNLKIMQSKYALVGLEYNDWFSYFNPVRDIKKEDILFYEVLKLIDGEKYVLKSVNYGSPPNFLKYPINIDTDKKIIELNFMENYTLFDWFKVIENSKEIYTIDSSINYLMEIIDTSNKNLYLWSRRGSDWSEIDYIFSKNYKLMN